MKNRLFINLTIRCLLLMSCKDGCNDLIDYPPKIYLVLADGDTVSHGQNTELEVLKGAQVKFEFFAKDDFAMRSLSYQSFFASTRHAKNTNGETSKDSMSFIWDSKQVPNTINTEIIKLSATDHEPCSH